jgi:hypothetical protein
VVRAARERGARNESIRAMLEETTPDEPVASPLSLRHCPRPADAACALVLSSEEARPTPMAWILGADHRTETGALGARDLSSLPAATLAAARARAIAGWSAARPPDVAEVAAPFAHQEPMLAEALALGGAEVPPAGGPTARRAHQTVVNPSGGALLADGATATGLVRLAECARQVAGRAGGHQTAGARTGLAHAAAGHALQQNLVWILEQGGAA